MEQTKKIDIVSIKIVKEKELATKYGITITQPSDVAEIIETMIGDKDREHLIVLAINSKNAINSITICAIGSLNSAIVHPREIFKTAILANAASIIIAHNHPSGSVLPSTEDINITNRIKECGILLGIELLDHLIIGGDGNWLSLKERGIL